VKTETRTVELEQRAFKDDVIYIPIPCDMADMLEAHPVGPYYVQLHADPQGNTLVRTMTLKEPEE
jgi:hypothetical protein